MVGRLSARVAVIYPVRDVSVLIVSWNTRELLRRCLRSLDGDAHELIVVDNASSDDSADAAVQEQPMATVIRSPTNLGFAGGVNRGLREATCPFVLLLNSDTVVAPGAIARLAAYLKQSPTHGAAGGRLVDEAGQSQRGFNVRRFPTVGSIAAELLLVHQLWPRNPVSRRYMALDVDDTRTQDVDQPAAACLMIRRNILDQMQGLDERFHPAWFEDVDLCRRIRDAGWRIAYVADAIFEHRGRAAKDILGLTAFSRIWYRNLRRYTAKHFGSTSHHLVGALVIIGMVLRIGVSGVKGATEPLKAYAAVLLDVLTGRPVDS